MTSHIDAVNESQSEDRMQALRLPSMADFHSALPSPLPTLGRLVWRQLHRWN